MSFARAFLRLHGSLASMPGHRLLSSACRLPRNGLTARVSPRHFKRHSLAVLISTSRHLSLSGHLLADDKPPPSESSKPSEDFFIPEPPTSPAPEADLSGELLVNHLGEPTFRSLDLGTSYFPSDFILRFLEMLHVDAGLPWWGVLGAATLTVRLALFPLVISYRRKSTNFSNNMPTLKRVQERMDTARLQNNMMEMGRLAKEMESFRERNEVVSMKSLLAFPFVNILVIVSFLSAIRQMANYPVVSMQSGGLFWFTDLTLPDTYCLLPVICMGSIYLIMELGVDMTKTSQQTPVMKYVMRAMPAVGFLFIMNMPSAVTFYFTMSNAVSVGQTLLLRTRSMRERFGIPEAVVHPPAAKAQKKGFWDTFSENKRRTEMLQLVMERERLDDKQFREAGKGLVKKTLPAPQRPPTAERTASPLRKI